MQAFKKIFLDWAPAPILAITAAILLLHNEAIGAAIIMYLSGFLTGFVLFRYLAR